MNRKIDSPKKKRTVNELFRSSLIIRSLGRLSSLIMRKLSTGFFGGLFTSYKKENEAINHSLVVAGTEKLHIDVRFTMPLKHKAAKWVEDSTVIGFVKRILNTLLSCSMKSYGIFLFSFALYSAIIYLIKLFYFNPNGEMTPDIGYIASVAIMLVASVGMIASRHCLGTALRTSPVSRFFLFDVVGLRTNCLEHVKASESRFHIAFFLGLLFGFTSFVIHPAVVMLLTAVPIIAYLVLIKPEFGVLAVMTALPFMPTMALVAAIMYVALCYLIKVMIGKRSVKFDLLDWVVLLFMFLMIGGGIFSVSVGSIPPMMVYVAFMLGYFLTVNLIRSREWIIRCVVGTSLSCTLVSLCGLYQNFFGTISNKWQDNSMFTDIAGRVVSTFENPNVLGEYLIMMIPVLFAMMVLAKAPRQKFAMFLALAAGCGCLIYTWSRGAWLGFIIGMLIFLLMYSKKNLTVILLGVFAVPFLPFILPDSIVNRFTSIGNMGDSSTSYRVNIWRGVIDMLGDFWEGGIGIGLAPFEVVYPKYSLDAIETAPHAHNLYLQILVEIGIVGLVVFVGAMFIYAQSNFSLHADDNRREKLIPIALFAGTLSVLAQGMTDYIWYNYRVFLMFWLLIGLGAAARRLLYVTAEDEKL